MSYLWYWPAGGYSFEAWKQSRDAAWQPPRSAQSGRGELLPLVSDTTTLAGWQQQADAWLQVSRELLGQLSDRPPQAMRWEFLSGPLVRTAVDGASLYTLRRLRYTLTEAEWGYAWLLVPSNHRHGRAVRLPAIIALHQTVPQGKAEPAGLESREDMAYAAELAEQGFVVLAPDAIGFGERQSGHLNTHYRSAEQFFAAHPAGSVMGKMIYDVQRAVDLLEGLSEVDASRIGCIGHSHGGYGTLLAMVEDSRIRCGAISCGLTLLRADPRPDRWWRQTALIPRLGLYEDVAQTPLDFHHWLALVAPRRLFASIALDDSIFPNTAALGSAFELARGVYRLHGAAERLHGYLYPGGHSFPLEARQQAYQVLSEELRL